MKEPEIRDWLKSQIESVFEALNNHNEEDQIDKISTMIVALERSKAAIEARYAIWSKPYPARYVVPWRAPNQLT